MRVAGWTRGEQQSPDEHRNRRLRTQSAREHRLPVGARARAEGCRRYGRDHASVVRTAFYIFGALAELMGIVLVASPDRVPGAVRLAGWALIESRKIGYQLRARIRLRPKSTTHSAEVAATAQTSGTVSAIKSSGAKTLEAKVEFLLTRDQEAQRGVTLLSNRLAQLENSVSRELTSLKDHVEGRIGERLPRPRPTNGRRANLASSRSWSVSPSVPRPTSCTPRLRTSCVPCRSAA